MNQISSLQFAYDQLDSLPGKVLGPTPSQQTPGIFFTQTFPTPVSNPKMLAWSAEAAQLLNIHGSLTPEEVLTATQIFSGNNIPSGCQPYATRYGGHQFGMWAGQLGDGRAITLGAIHNSRKERWEVQLKGAGPTPYSRSADGRAVLRSSLREFLCSEALFHLGIPTTRALCCVTTGDSVVRDLFYDGNPQSEPGAITTRIAPSFLRLGHYEVLAAQEELELLKTLVFKTISDLFPNIKASSQDELLQNWFLEVALRTADLMVHWQRVGFVHGVMNTDNLSILGITIDYGPYGWLDVYDPDWTPNTTDSERRRYRFGNQPSIALWNLSRFASALLPLFTDTKSAIKKLEGALEAYKRSFQENYLKMRSKKLGLLPESKTQTLIAELDELLVSSETDMTLFYRLLYRALSTQSTQWTPLSLLDSIRESFYSENLPSQIEQNWINWLTQYFSQWQSQPNIEEHLLEMEKSNPYFILRNYLVQEALDHLTTGNQTLLHQLLEALKNPYQENPLTSSFFKRRPEWARNKAGCSALSCSS